MKRATVILAIVLAIACTAAAADNIQTLHGLGGFVQKSTGVSEVRPSVAPTSLGTVNLTTARIMPNSFSILQVQPITDFLAILKATSFNAGVWQSSSGVTSPTTYGVFASGNSLATYSPPITQLNDTYNYSGDTVVAWFQHGNMIAVLEKTGSFTMRIDFVKGKPPFIQLNLSLSGLVLTGTSTLVVGPGNAYSVQLAGSGLSGYPGAQFTGTAAGYLWESNATATSAVFRVAAQSGTQVLVLDGSFGSFKLPLCDNTTTTC